ncbi:hypothetical protein TBLA_0C02340 [Henningerozyma blattae CBS 6284]|uniref:Uncharacterized protein n=1 Tax=Henningerozyma blattae (strain ATCC 34711 / CBS 6284 / DSM 70876 / NBRC 10599 / NRRL Y-10934 / UCD 77-7) TaxID=1071380 RepID=I2H0Z3_HENB6|nr:hypothetical protein TBLA_0C02340 [Tetrapisispora blattae CBS 6284]CCH60045.1 hypothetical protein TBLA_0C02340 [Tetrapisispora blattae CBS 6284]
MSILRHNHIPTSSLLLNAKKYQLYDTLSLFIIFQSLNHLLIILLLVSFIIFSNYHQLLSDGFIKCFINKKYTSLNSISNKSSNFRLFNSNVNNNNTNCTISNNISNDNVNTIGFSSLKPSIHHSNSHHHYHSSLHSNLNSSKNNNNNNNSKFHWSNSIKKISIVVFFIEFIIIFIFYKINQPVILNLIQNLSLSILSSSLINTTLNYFQFAIFNSLIYSISINFYFKLIKLYSINNYNSNNNNNSNISNGINNTNNGFIKNPDSNDFEFNNFPNLNLNISSSIILRFNNHFNLKNRFNYFTIRNFKKLDELNHFLNNNNYIIFLHLYLSFHIVSQTIINHLINSITNHYSNTNTTTNLNLDTTTVNVISINNNTSSFTTNTTNLNSNGASVANLTSSSLSNNSIPDTNSVLTNNNDKIHQAGINLNSNMYNSGSNSNLSSTSSNLQAGSEHIPIIQNSPMSQAIVKDIHISTNTVFFTDIVSDYKIYEPTVVSTSDNNIQIVSTNLTDQHSNNNISSTNNVNNSNSINTNLNPTLNFNTHNVINTSSDNPVCNNKTYLNQLYELNVNLGKYTDINEIRINGNDSIINNDLKFTITSNLENFIKRIFSNTSNFKTTLISPFWTVFLVLKTIYNEKNYIDEIDTLFSTALPTTFHSSTENNQDEKILPINSFEPSELTIKNKSVFNNNSFDILNIDYSVYNSNNTNTSTSPSPANICSPSITSNSTGNNGMALVAQNKANDYYQLNLISNSSTQFTINNYKVSIISIQSNSVLFHIENLFDGLLIVFVNGILWSEVSYALIMEHKGQELAEISGLVPSSSYDIKFINRTTRNDDYLMADIILRTSSSLNTTENNTNSSSNTNNSNNNQSNIKKDKYSQERFEQLDFSFPSYYHRKFLSPILTLKHSILTTNANLSEERLKLKKTKKEISKKLNALKNDIDNIKIKINQKSSNDVKMASKIESLRISLNQTETTISNLEKKLKYYVEQEVLIEENYLKNKDIHLKRQLEYGKLKDTLQNDIINNKKKSLQADEELKKLTNKKDKLETEEKNLSIENNKRTKEFNSAKEEFLSLFKDQAAFMEEKRKLQKNEYSLEAKGLEQDIARLKSENDHLREIYGA